MKDSRYEAMVKGPVNILFTPFNEDASLINEEQLQKNIRFLIDEGMGKECGMIVVGGSTGDCYVMTLAERKRLFEAALEAADGECPIWCGINSTSTAEAIELAQHAEKYGACGVMSVPPFYWINPSKEILYTHYKQLSDNCSLGIMIYNNPQIIAQDISLENLAMLAEIEHIVALKECSANMIKFKLVVEQLADKIVVINGAGEWIEPQGYQMGTTAFISGYSNMFPKACINIHKLAMQRKYSEVEEIIDRFKPLKMILWNAVQKYGAPVEAKVYKEMATVLGFNEGGSRLPILPLAEDIMDELRKIMPTIQF